MSCTFNKPSTKDWLFNNQRSVCPLCDINSSIQLLHVEKIEWGLIAQITTKCFYILQYLWLFDYHNMSWWKKLQKHQCILKKEWFHLNDFVSVNGFHTDHSKKQNDLVSLISSPTLNEAVGEVEESNYINFNTTDTSFQNNATLSSTFYGDKHSEVNLQPEEFYNLSYQHDRMNGNHTPIFSWIFFWQNHLLMCKEGKLLGGLCRLFHRSVYQDFDSLSMIPVSGTILILQPLDVLLDVTKRQKGFMGLMSQMFNTFVKPHLVDPNVSFHFPTSMKGLMRCY